MPASFSPNPTTVREVVALYLQRRHSLHKRTAEDKAHVLRRFCADNGDLLLSVARPYHLQLWIDRECREKSDWTTRRWISSVKACFAWAVRLGVIDRHPFLGVWHRAGKRGRPLTDDEFAALLRTATDGRLRRFLLFLRITGCRPGEAAHATWADVMGGTIRLAEHKTAAKVGRPRVIYLSALACRLLSWIRRHDPGDGKFIFLNRIGRPWQNTTLCQRLKIMREKAGLPRDAKLYGLRHKLATDAILNGVDVATLAELLGHSGTAQTMHYVHLAGQSNHLRDAIQRAAGK